MLIGACNPMLRPLRVIRQSRMAIPSYDSNPDFTDDTASGCADFDIILTRLSSLASVLPSPQSRLFIYFLLDDPC